MVDAVKYNLDGIDFATFARFICDRGGSVGADGVLLLVERDGMFGMRMFNPDGSEAEMCGNGIRCVARLAEEYTGVDKFDMFSGGNTYAITHAEDIYLGIPTYGVDLKVRLASSDFGFAKGAERFVSQRIERLDDNLLWTAINVGNPHIVAACFGVARGVPEGDKCIAREGAGRESNICGDIRAWRRYYGFVRYCNDFECYGYGVEWSLRL